MFSEVITREHREEIGNRHFVILQEVLSRILPGKSILKLKSSAYEKYEFGHLGCWYIKLTLFKRF